ncbi:MAG: hypothetical protein ACFFF9_01025 [Candidatus Thorarchaeota archaeon]
MSSKNPLEDWYFLIGEWEGGSTDQFDEEGTIKTSEVYTLELNGVYIMGRHDAFNKDGNLIHKALSMLYYDRHNKIMLRKTFYSYGFTNNEVELERTDDMIRFEVVQEPIPQAFDGMKWRSYIKKVSETEIRDGLEVCKPGEDFSSYGESVSKKIK